MFACDPSIAFLLFGKQQTAKFSRRMTKNQKGRTTWTMREAFQEVSPCRTTTTSVNSSSPLGAAAGVGDMVRLVAAAAASLSLCRSREGGYPPDILPGFTAASRKEPRRWSLLQPDAAGLDGCCGGMRTEGTASSIFPLLFASCLLATKLVSLKRFLLLSWCKGILKSTRPRFPS